jgi:beta-1,2-xylosyltransferase
MELGRYPRKELSAYYMDVALAGGNWQCDGNDGTCDEMDKEIEWAEKEASEKSNEFKYVFDVSDSVDACEWAIQNRAMLMAQTDGNAWSSRFPRLMASNKYVNWVRICMGKTNQTALSSKPLSSPSGVSGSSR